MLVSVVMASCNPQVDLLKNAIFSILRQTYKEFELIVVDDGSDEPLLSVVRSISNDNRIIVYRINNSGLGAALNEGISHSRGHYIARLDDDDMMAPDRLMKQVGFLESHPEVVCVGTWHYDLFHGKYYPHRKFPTEHDTIISSLLHFRFSLAHTTLMFRRDAFNQIGGYRIQRGGQDLDLELQLGSVGKLANIPEYLNYYTMSAHGLGTVNPQKYQAYLFALQDVVDRNLFPQMRDVTMSSIKRLKFIDNSPVKSVREKLIRNLLVLRVKWFGREMEPIVYKNV